MLLIATLLCIGLGTLHATTFEFCVDIVSSTEDNIKNTKHLTIANVNLPKKYRYYNN